MTGSLIDLNLGALAKPVEVLIERVSDAVGGFARPWQIERLAKAESKAEIAKAEARIQISEIERRALSRLLKEEGIRQENIEAITIEAAQEVNDSARPDLIEQDWLTNFFEKCRNVSDRQMQEMWAKILSGESNKPGSFKSKTINLLTQIDKSDAVSFSKLSAFRFEVSPRVFIFVPPTETEICKERGIDFEFLTALDEMGLVKFDSIAGFKLTSEMQEVTVSYGGKTVNLKLKEDKQISIGNVLLTTAGSQILSICSPIYDETVNRYYDNEWVSRGFEELR